MIVSSTSSEYATDDSGKARMRQMRMTAPLTWILLVEINR